MSDEVETAPALQPRRKKLDVDGWLILDKPSGMTSTHAVARAKRIFSAKKAGHAGTLDPLATGCLPIAFGEATKTVPYAMDGRKTYLFTVRWGEETDTDDSEGRVVETSEVRPQADAIKALLPRFTGLISQIPPRYSAIKIAGERAYDLARDGEAVELQARDIEVHDLKLVAMPDEVTAEFSAECGKGTYVRALARDMGRALGCFGHVIGLRRTSVGPFKFEHMVLLEELERQAEAGTQENILLPVDTALDEIPAVTISRSDAARLMRGQSVLLRGRDAPILTGTVSVRTGTQLVALADIEGAELHPRRVFRLPEGL
ncbi:tRNA pseudouridine synthase B [Agaricicola taiwanensis]|uniref:tRNA pseudouridine synthase B n=1 Tax=Agaricicola taiwanensis TaxID=591372 RepID=A0A8J2YFK2_9RHOB|nr:tRNA pseudouridine(55) synthase TruB [Agaricicola taiwanensis]GGE29312.1 tRNA pseudouridine synthase B [Agaricicola taiwanensis]